MKMEDGFDGIINKTLIMTDLQFVTIIIMLITIIIQTRKK